MSVFRVFSERVCGHVMNIRNDTKNAISIKSKVTLGPDTDPAANTTSSHYNPISRLHPE